MSTFARFAANLAAQSPAPEKQTPAAETSPAGLRIEPIGEPGEGLHNVFRLAPRLLSGSEPEGEDAFASLAKLGVTTIVSVDGATPNVEAARKQGLRYVHVPIGYDGVEPESQRSFAALGRVLQGRLSDPGSEVVSPAGRKPVLYVHCHHGKHRGPAAAAMICVSAGLASNDEAKRILERAGTSPDYAGLWRDVASFRTPAANEKLPPLVESAKVESLTAAMASADRHADNLQLCRDSAWKAPRNHPDIVPAQEALLLKESFREAVRTLDKEAPAKLRAGLVAAESDAAELEQMLRDGSLEGATRKLLAMRDECKRCHETHRDNR